MRSFSWIACCLVLGAGTAAAQTGVSDDRVSLPDGPGSIEGIGDNVSVDGNMGAMSYAVPIELPAGYPGMTPELSLAYSSSAGNGLVGVGWSMHVPSIERLTLRGLPRYVADDEFAADGSEQLVRVSQSGSDAVYRARFERSFVRYTWRGVGEAGYWTAEYPDGRVGYFGATSDGTLVPEARLESAAGETFRYFLVELVDVHGHRVRYEYEKSGVVPLLRSIGWVFEGAEPRYAVELEYEPRPDPISDAQPGFEELLTERVWFVRVRSRGEAIRAYRLTYEDEATSGGFSRLSRVERIGQHGSVYPVVNTFGYSRSLGGVCGGARCDRPFLVDMGTLAGAAAIATGDATLVDINGDALPDLVDSSVAGGNHRFYLNVLEASGRARFEAPRSSATTPRSGFELNQAYVQVLDINGDGFADLINARSGQARCNGASGDWELTGCGALSDEGIRLDDDGIQNDGDTDPVHTRFVDLNGDRRIDLLRTNIGGNVQAWLNTGSGFTELSDVQPIGRTFDADRLQLADMNGDGLLDPVVVESGTVRYRLSLGWGRWADWVTIDGPTIGSDSDMNDTELQDLNGDGLDDLVIVQASTVRYSLNRGAGRFDPFVAITGPDVEGGLPLRDTTTTVLFADMNGSGSQDAVWVQADGQVSFLELFPVRPNLMSRVENGLGMVHAITYGTSVAHQAVSETPWRYTLPHAMNVVDRTDTWVTLTGGEDGEGLHEVVEHAYRDGYYDGVEKAFRGFAHVEQRMLAELSRDSQEPALTIQEFDVGATDPYFAGLPLSSAVFSGEDARPLSEERHTYADCDVAGIPSSGLRFPVRHICEVETTTIRQEGASESEWATTRTRNEYDGYGQVVRSENLGVVHMGPPESPSACLPCDRPDGFFGGACGESCTGDEMIEVRELIEPGSATGDRWILGMPHTVRRFAADGATASEERTYYDGPDFVGLALGQLRKGLPTRTTTLASPGVVLESARNAYDEHGNVVATLDPLGSPDDTTGHRRAYTYDAAGLRVVRTEIFVSSGMGEPYTLRQEYSYEPAFDKVVESTAWMVGGSARNSTYYAYDEFARIVAIAKPGDSLAAPTMEVRWELGDPASRIVVQRRTQPGGPLDLTSVQCMDGRGRNYQERTRIDEGEWLANGFTEYNRRGAEVRIHQPYTATSGDCPLEPPSDVAFTTIQYDGAQREVRRTLPDAAIYGSASITRTAYEPLATLTYDANDSDPESPHADTPDVVRVDGLGRPVTVERLLRTEDGVERAATRLVYDSVGSLSGYVDALGNLKTQEIDLANRLVRIVDPNTGETRFEHDAAGNVIRRIDARGVATRMEYDGANRPIARWDEASPESTRVTYRYDRAEDCASCTNTAGQVVAARFPLPAEVAALLGGATGEDRFGYDARGRGVYTARALGSALFETTGVFDGADRPLETRFPDGQRIVRAFDGASRSIAIEGLVERIEYEPRGALARVLRADGSEDVMEHDTLLRLARLTSTDAQGSAFADWRYERDRHGQILGIEDRAERPFARSDARYTYDAWYRVRGAELEAGTVRAETLSWTFDAIDNTLSATSTVGGLSTAHVGAYEYERPGVASRAGGLALTHDPAGYLTARGELALEWDYLGRLVSASREDESRAVFAYGPDQNRVAKLENGALTLYVGPDFEVRDGVSRAYARVERNRVAKVQSAELGVALYGDASGSGDVDAADAWLTREETALLSARHHAAARRFLHEAAPEPVQLFTDHLGSLSAATRDGEVVGLRRYHPFGAIRAERGFIDERGFTGQERDASTGLLAFQWRYLDPHTGRWISADPAFESVGDDMARLFEGIGRYTYVRGDAMNAFDPTGLMFRAALTRVASQARPGISSVFAQVMRDITLYRGTSREEAEQIVRDGHLVSAAARNGSSVDDINRVLNNPELMDQVLVQHNRASDAKMYVKDGMNTIELNGSPLVSATHRFEAAQSFAGEGGAVVQFDVPDGVEVPGGTDLADNPQEGQRLLRDRTKVQNATIISGDGNREQAR